MCSLSLIVQMCMILMDVFAVLTHTQKRFHPLGLQHGSGRICTMKICCRRAATLGSCVPQHNLLISLSAATANDETALLHKTKCVLAARAKAKSCVTLAAGQALLPPIVDAVSGQALQAMADGFIVAKKIIVNIPERKCVTENYILLCCNLTFDSGLG